MICFQDLTWLFSYNSLEHYNRWQSNNLMVQLVMHLDKEKLMLFMCKTYRTRISFNARPDLHCKQVANYWVSRRVVNVIKLESISFRRRRSAAVVEHNSVMKIFCIHFRWQFLHYLAGIIFVICFGRRFILKLWSEPGNDCQRYVLRTKELTIFFQSCILSLQPKEAQLNRILISENQNDAYGISSVKCIKNKETVWRPIYQKPDTYVDHWKHFWFMSMEVIK